MSQDSRPAPSSDQRLRRALELLASQDAAKEADASGELHGLLEWLLSPKESVDGASLSDEESLLAARLKELSQRNTEVRFEQRGEVARGGMGAIYEVFDRDLRRTVAMKVALGPVASDSASSSATPLPALSRFIEEAQVTGQLDHPGVVPVHELGLGTDGRVYFTMKMVDGRTLAETLAEIPQGEGTPITAQLIAMLVRVCETMSFAHDHGVVHRDLKPANVMIGRYGEVYVMDWGLARAEWLSHVHDVRLRESGGVPSQRMDTDRKDLRSRTASSPLVTMDGAVVGTPYYMPPEQARGEVDKVGPASDIYSLGAILYQMLCGEAPYRQKSKSPNPHSVLKKVRRQPPLEVERLAPHAPAELVSICERAMAREPDDRYPNMGALAADLGAWLDGRVVDAHGGGLAVQLRKWVLRNRHLAAALALAAVALLSGSWIALAQRGLALERAAELELALSSESAALRIAEGQRLASDALAVGKDDPTLALLLALEASKRASGIGINRALYSALENQRELHVFTGHDARVLDVKVSQGGRFSHSVDSTQLQIVWDLESREVCWTADAHQERVVGIGFTASGQYAFSASQEGALYLREVATGRVAALHDLARPIRRVQAVMGADDVLVHCEDGSLWRASAEGNSELEQLEPPENGILAFDCYGDRLALMGPNHVLRVRALSQPDDLFRFDLTPWTSGAVAAAPMNDKKPPSVMLGSDGSHVLACWAGSHLGIWNTTAVEGFRLLADSTDRGYITPSRDRSSFYHNTRGETGTCWSFPEGKPLCKLPLIESYDIRAGDPLVLGRPGSETTLSLYDGQTGASVEQFVGHQRPLETAVFVDPQTILSASRDRTLRLWSVPPARGATVFDLTGAGRFLLQSVNALGEPLGLRENRKGSAVLAVAHDGGASIPITQGRRIRSSGWSPSGRLAWIHLSSRETSPPLLIVWDSAEEKTVFEWQIPPDSEYVVRTASTISQDDGTLAVLLRHRETTPRHDRPGRVKLFRLGDGTETADWVVPSDPYQASFDPSGDKVAIVHRHPGFASVRSRATGAELGRTAGHSAMILSGSFNPDGSRFATHAIDSTIRLFDTADLALQGVIQEVPTKLRGMVWSPDSTMLVAFGIGEIGVYTVPTQTTVTRWPLRDGEEVVHVQFDEAGGEVSIRLRDGSIRRYPMDPAARCGELAPRPLTVGEMLDHGIGTAEGHRMQASRVRLWRGDTDSLCAEALEHIRRHELEEAKALLDRVMKRRPSAIERESYVEARDALRSLLGETQSSLE